MGVSLKRRQFTNARHYVWLFVFSTIGLLIFSPSRAVQAVGEAVVNQRSGTSFASLQEALQDTGLQAGDELHVTPGTYSSLDFSGTLPDDITIRVTTPGSAFIPYISFDGSTFNGLSIEGFSFIGTSALPHDAQFSIASSGSYQNLTLRNNIFDGNQNTVRAISTTQPINNLKVESNQFTGFRERSEEPFLYSVVLLSNTSGTANGLTVRDNHLSDSTIPSFIESFSYKNVMIDDNSARSPAGQILVWSGQSATLESVTLSNNIVDTSGDYGIAVFGNTQTHNEIINNQVSGQSVCIIAPLLERVTISGNALSNCGHLGISLAASLPGFFDTELLEASVVYNTISNTPNGISNGNQLYISSCVNTFSTVETHTVGNVSCIDNDGPVFTQIEFKNQENEQIITASPGQLIMVTVHIADASTVINPSVRLSVADGTFVQSPLDATSESEVYTATFTAPTIANKASSDKAVLMLGFAFTAIDFLGNIGKMQASLPLFSFVDQSPPPVAANNPTDTSTPASIQQSSPITSQQVVANTRDDESAGEVLAAQTDSETSPTNNSFDATPTTSGTEILPASCTRWFGLCRATAIYAFVCIATLLGCISVFKLRSATN